MYIVGKCFVCAVFPGVLMNAKKNNRGRKPSEKLSKDAANRARLNEMRLSALYHLTYMDDAPEEDVMRFVVESITRLTGSALGYLFISESGTTEKGYMVWSRAHYDFLDEEYLPKDHLPAAEFRLWHDKTGKRVYRTVNNGDGVHPTHSAFGGRLPVMRFMHAPAMRGKPLMCVAAVCNKPDDYEESDLQQLELFLNGVWLILRRREFVQQLKKAKEISERANRAKDEFLANISHELRTPLNGMLSMIELLRLSPLSREQEEYARAADHSGKALLRILSDILDFSRMAAGRMELHCAPFSVADAIRSCLDLFASEATQKGLRLTAEIGQNLPRELLGDEARLRQIIFNLVSNALKFTDQGGVTVRCSLLPHTREGKTWIYLAVEDTGIGIPEADMDVLFDPFVRLPNALIRKSPGTGLGLGIVRNLLRVMDGNLAVETWEGTGTTVHCSLGFIRATARIVPPEPESGVSRAIPPVVLDVLVAEDDAVSKFALRALLQRFGHRVVCVDNGRQALEALLLHPFHCLITDIQMPVMDGLEMVRRIRVNKLDDITVSEGTRAQVAEVFPCDGTGRDAVPVDLPVAALTAHAMIGDKERFLSQGIDLYLSKPVGSRELFRVLRQIAAVSGGSSAGWELRNTPEGNPFFRNEGPRGISGR